MFHPKRILVPMDFSNEALLALHWAVMLAKQSRVVRLFPIYIYSMLPDAVAIDVGRTAYKEVKQAWVKSKMADLQKKIPRSVRWNPVYATGHPAKVVIKTCRSKSIDLVVMTTHGRKGLSHLLHGSVAEAVVRSAPCPVLVLHMNDLRDTKAQKPASARKT